MKNKESEYGGPLPSADQLAWHEREFYGFIHFGINTFTDREWGYGDESPQLFNPSDFSAGAIADTAAEAGMSGLVLTCKHHDGFCLWPSAYTEHSVKNSPWKNGRGDMVAEFSRACAERGLAFGVYLSPWDRNHRDYGRPAYREYYRSQLSELTENYGELFEVWFDGANGGDGYYGGAREVRTINRKTYYGWEETWSAVRANQPGARIFSDAGPDIRWVGNERGIAGDPCWYGLSPEDLYPGFGDDLTGVETDMVQAWGADGDMLGRGDPEGSVWVPPECDVSIRPGWFYHENEDDRVKSAEELMELYFLSVGRGANLLLNIPPDRTGRIHEKDRAELIRFRRLRENLFSRNLFDEARSGKTDGAWTFRWDRPVRFNVLEWGEELSRGQRVRRYAVDLLEDGSWRFLCGGESLGRRKLIRCGDTTARGVRLRILESSGQPEIGRAGLYHMAKSEI